MPIDRPIGNERKSDREKPKQKRIVNKSSRTDTHEGSCGVIRRQKIKSPTGTLSWFFFFFLYLVPNDGSSVPLEFLFLSSSFDCFLLFFLKGFYFSVLLFWPSLRVAYSIRGSLENGPLSTDA